MFEASLARIFATDAAEVVGFVPQAAYEASAAQLVQTEPYFWQGRSMGSVWGLHARLMVRAMTTADGTSVYVTVGAEFEQTALIAFVLLCVFFLPVAAILGILAYNDFTARRFVVLEGLFSRLSAATGKPALAVGFGPTPYGAYPPPGYGAPPR